MKPEDLPSFIDPTSLKSDFSIMRNSLLNEILYFFPILYGSTYVTDRPADPSKFPAIGTVPIYDGRRAAIDRDHLSPDAGIAAEVLKKPIAVFIEIYGTANTREKTTVETFVGVVPLSAKARLLAAVRIQEGVVVDVKIATGDTNAANWTILQAVRGIHSFSVAFP
jgi:hypothetical protein